MSLTQAIALGQKVKRFEDDFHSTAGLFTYRTESLPDDLRGTSGVWLLSGITPATGETPDRLTSDYCALIAAHNAAALPTGTRYYATANAFYNHLPTSGADAKACAALANYEE